MMIRVRRSERRTRMVFLMELARDGRLALRAILSQ